VPFSADVALSPRGRRPRLNVSVGGRANTQAHTERRPCALEARRTDGSGAGHRPRVGSLGTAACAHKLSRSNESADVSRIKSEHVGGQLSTYRVGHDSNGPFDVLLSDCDQAVLICQYLGSSGTRPIEPGDGARMAAVECSKSALRFTHGFAHDRPSPSRRGPGEPAI
jgi:hypothetical protein